MKTTFKKIVVVTFALACVCLSPLAAEPVKVSHTQIELISKESSVKPGRPMEVAIRMMLDDHWHTYWRNPGDSGMSASVKWNLPEGFEAGDIQWPYPKKFDEGGMVTYGYDHEVWLLSEIKVPESFEVGTVVPIEANVKWLVCEKICVPAKATIKMEIPVDDRRPIANDDLASGFEKFQKRVPIKEATWDINVLDREEDFIINIIPQEPLQDWVGVQFFPYGEEIIDHAGEQIFKKKEGGYELIVRKSTYVDQEVQQMEGVLVFDEGWDAKGVRAALEVNATILKNIQRKF